MVDREKLKALILVGLKKGFVLVQTAEEWSRTNSKLELCPAERRLLKEAFVSETLYF